MTFTVFWQPDCTSCLRTSEFLRTHGIEAGPRRLWNPEVPLR